MAKIPFNIPPFIGTELTYVQQAIDAHKICGDGQFTKNCNHWITNRFGGVRTLLTTSGTTALEMATLLCGLGEGDEVILPSFTFSRPHRRVAISSAVVPLVVSSAPAAPKRSTSHALHFLVNCPSPQILCASIACCT